MLGIDVSKDTLACTLFDPHTHKALWSKSFPNTAQGIARLLKQTPAESPWALEPTGRYSTAPAKLARKAGRDVRLAQPKAAQRFLQSLQSRNRCNRAPKLTSSIAWASGCLPYRARCRLIRSSPQ